MDQHKVIKISKKYTNRTVKSWEHPSSQVVSSIRKILKMQKTKALQITNSNDKKHNHLIQQDIDIDDFIKVFISQLKKSKLPKGQQNELDFDHDYQLKKEKYLVNLISNEINQLNNLKLNLKQEKQKNKDLQKFLKNYETLYQKEIESLEQVQSTTSSLDNENIKTLNLEESQSEEINDIITDLRTTLSDLNHKTIKYQTISSKLDDLLS